MPGLGGVACGPGGGEGAGVLQGEAAGPGPAGVPGAQVVPPHTLPPDMTRF